MTSQHRILIADDHPIVRKGIVSLIQTDPLFSVVAECGNGLETTELLMRHKPHIAVLDIAMPGRSGLDILRWAKKRGASWKFILLTMYADREYLEAALGSGVNGYILKESAVHELMAALHAVASGQDYISPSFAAQHLKKEVAGARSGHPVWFGDLTPTERQIMIYISQSFTSRQIADHMNISVRTVQNHRFNICQKLEFKGHHRLLQFAVEHRTQLEKFAS